MNNYNPYMNMPYQGDGSPLDLQQKNETTYKNQNSTTHFIMGIAAGAAIAYLLTNKKFRKGVAATGEKAWSAVRGEVEELKERLEDTQAELEYYRNLHKGE
jgi:uncharacterized membrane protein YebE (DUF533 family)